MGEGYVSETTQIVAGADGSRIGESVEGMEWEQGSQEWSQEARWRSFPISGWVPEPAAAFICHVCCPIEQVPSVPADPQ